MSLFAEYPQGEPSEPKPPSCCAYLMAPGHVEARTWAMVHAYGHSRVPVTVLVLAMTADITPAAARTAIAAGQSAGWLAPVGAERHERTPAPRWIGRLPHKR
jgi:hypothetical protein